MLEIEYFYSTHSAFAYIGSQLFLDIARRNGCRIIHRPVDLNAVISATSGKPYGHWSEAHKSYFFDREIERWADYRGAPLINHRPTWHDEPLDLPNGFVIAAMNQGYSADKLVHEILKAHWLEDANHTDPDLLVSIAHELGIDGAPLIEISHSDEIQEIHKMNTQEAIRRSIFGSPTYFLNGDMFYGQDHLELLESAIKRAESN